MVEPKKNRIFQRLHREAMEQTLIGKSRHVSAIVYRHKIVCIGKAQRKTHPFIEEYLVQPKRNFLHAETHAIVKFLGSYGQDNLKDFDIYNFRLTKSDNIGRSKPCPNCTGVIKALGFRDVYWTEFSKSFDKLKISSSSVRGLSIPENCCDCEDEHYQRGEYPID